MNTTNQTIVIVVITINVLFLLRVIYNMYFKPVSKAKQAKQDDEMYSLIDNTEYNKSMQQMEDNIVERRIKFEAQKTFDRWVRDKDKYAVQVPIYFDMPVSTYTIHHEDTAKFLKADINKLVREEFNKLTALQK